MAESCIFCRIAGKEIPAKIVVETEDAVVFEDIKPATPVHYLVIPRKHIATLNEAVEEDRAVLGGLLLAASTAAGKLGVKDAGWRLVFNTNRDAGQEVFHVHAHLMAGRRFRWPPG